MAIKTDTLIIGAGLIGSSVAMHLAQLGVKGIRVVDFDLEGSLSSSELNAGGVRATWNQKINILSSKLSIEYFESVAAEVGYRPCGYLWLCDKEKLKASETSTKLQNSLGWPVEMLDNKATRDRVPFVDKLESLEGAVWAPRDGLLNPNRLKNHFREKAANLGVSFDDRVWIEGVESFDQGKKLKLMGKNFLNKPIDLEQKKAILTGQSHDLKSRETVYTASRVVNCAGAWSSQFAKILGYKIPSNPVRRQVCIFDSRDVDLSPYGMTIEPSGVYFHPEATNGLAGFANPEEPSGFNYRYDNDSFFMEKIWPALYETSTKFEQLKHVTGWAGLYMVSPDHSAIIGNVGYDKNVVFEHVYEAHSFSGHGAMHSYTAGLGLAELMVKGKYQTCDLTPFNGKRFGDGQLFREGWVI